jgi:hypothetical protein
MNQTKPGIGCDPMHSIADRTGLRVLNATIDAVLAAEAAGDFDWAARKAMSLAGEARAAFGAVDHAAPSAADRMTAGTRPN